MPRYVAWSQPLPLQLYLRAVRSYIVQHPALCLSDYTAVCVCKIGTRKAQTTKSILQGLRKQLYLRAVRSYIVQHPALQVVVIESSTILINHKPEVTEMLTVYSFSVQRELKLYNFSLKLFCGMTSCH